jgi:NTE family protein
MDGLGTPDAQSADLMSYLLFDGSYTRALIDIGYRDADAAIDELEHFVRTEAATVAAGPAGPRPGREKFSLYARTYPVLQEP